MAYYKKLYHDLVSAIDDVLTLMDSQGEADDKFILKRSQQILQAALSEAEEVIMEEGDQDGWVLEQFRELAQELDARAEERKKQTIRYKLKEKIKEYLKKRERS